MQLQSLAICIRKQTFGLYGTVQKYVRKDNTWSSGQIVEQKKNMLPCQHQVYCMRLKIQPNVLNFWPNCKITFYIFYKLTH